jgi:hypothetical protein
MPVTNTGAESNGISAHGTIIKRNGTPIAELRDITLPALTRKAIETTTHNSDDDSYVVGIRRKGELQFMLNFLPSADATHDAIHGTARRVGDRLEGPLRGGLHGRRGLEVLRVRQQHRSEGSGGRRAVGFGEHPPERRSGVPAVTHGRIDTD